MYIFKMMSKSNFILMIYISYGSLTNAITLHSYKESTYPSHSSFYNAMTGSVSVMSVLDCASVCSIVSGCWGFKFYHANMTCQIRKGLKKTTPKNEATAFTSFTNTGEKKCPDDFTWNMELDFCYKIETKTRRNWEDAQMACEKETEGGRLVILDSKAKHQALIDDFNKNQHVDDVYVGGRRNSEQEDFRWTDGQLTDPVLWCEGEPKEKLCGNLWPGKGFCLDDTTCYYGQAYVCEKPL